MLNTNVPNPSLNDNILEDRSMEHHRGDTGRLLRSIALSSTTPLGDELGAAANGLPPSS